VSVHLDAMEDAYDGSEVIHLDAPPSLYCLACASRKRDEHRRVEYLENAIAQAVADLEGGAPREVVTVNLAITIGPM
jgi:hypothetical protein